jgi:hypothetical protein
MTRELLIDAIRRELERQAKGRRLRLVRGPKPDDVQVSGEIDLVALAEALAR